MPRRKSKTNQLEAMSQKITDWMGTPVSVLVHTFIFSASFLLILAGVSSSTVMLGLTTAVSLEAIYLALFIQMTVNRQAKAISEVEKDIDEIQEDVESLEDIQEDIHLEEIGTDQDFAKTELSLKSIESQLIQLHQTIIHLKTHLAQQSPTPSDSTASISE